MNNVIQFPVAQILSGGEARVGRVRIESPSNLGIAASVIRVTERAVIREMSHGLLQHSRTGRNRVCGIACAPWDRNEAQPSSDERLSGARVTPGAETP